MDPLLTIGDVAEQLSVPEATLRYWRYAGTGPTTIKVGRHVRYRKSDVEAFIEQNATPAAS